MRTRFIMCIVFGCALARCAPAEDKYPVLVYLCNRVDQPPVIDGNVDDPCWNDAPWTSGFTYYNKNVVVDVQTAFRLLFDDRALYVAVRSNEPLVKRLTKSPPATRDTHSAVFGEEAIEIFVDPMHDHRQYYQIAVSLSGSMYDGRETDASWNSQTRAATAIGEDHWLLEVAIPWKDLGMQTVKNGSVIGFNVCRDRNVNDAKQWTCWSQIEANFHDPERFGHVLLGGSAETAGEMLAEYRKGGRSGPIHIFSASGTSQTSYVALVRAALKELDRAIEELEMFRQNEKSEAIALALQRKLDDVRQQTMGLRNKVARSEAIDAIECFQSEQTINSLVEDLRQSLWKIRLEALLADI